MKNEGLKMIANAVDVWLMTNTNLDVEKVVDLKEFIIDLDKPRDIIAEDGTILRVTNPRKEHSVEIKPTESGKEMLKRTMASYDGMLKELASQGIKLYPPKKEQE